jgi:uncharacterized membrane protein YvbJ
MYCAKCGAQNPDDGKFCQKCGATLTQTMAPPSAPTATSATAQPAVTGTRTSGLAVASLVLGIIGLLINFLAILAIIFGAIGISQTGKDPNLKGRGMAVAGLVLGIFSIALWIAMIVWASSAFWWLSNFNW